VKKASTMYLGRALNLVEPHDAELKHRMARAWAKFSQYKGQLTDQDYSLYQRLRLFESVVTPTALYGCCCWAMTSNRERELRSTQRKMLRMILGKGRRPIDSDNSIDIIGEEFDDDGNCDNLEPWVDWIRRTTHDALAAIARIGIPEWTELQHRRTWRWAGHVLRRDDGRWTRRVLEWTPGGSRQRGRPKVRWIDGLNTFFSQLTGISSSSEVFAFWQTTAQDREAWQLLEDDFV
jgi:hypothetical protein